MTKIKKGLTLNTILIYLLTGKCETQHLKDLSNSSLKLKNISRSKNKNCDIGSIQNLGGFVGFR